MRIPFGRRFCPFLLSSKALATFASVCVCLMFTSNANADLVSYWNFNTWSGDNTDRSIVADDGLNPGTLTVDADWTQISNSGGGTVLNRVGSTPAGQGLTMLDPVGDDSQDKGFQIELDTTGFEDMVVSWAERRDAEGYQRNTVFYSTDGVNFIEASEESPGTSYDTFTVDLSAIAGLNDQSSVFVRWEFSATFDDGAIGRNIIDNIQINMAALDGRPDPPATPEPSVIVGSSGLLVAMGTTYLRRRKKRKTGSSTEEDSET